MYSYSTQHSTTDHFFNDDVETILVTEDTDTVDFNVENISTLVDPSLPLPTFGASSNVDFSVEHNSTLVDPSLPRVLLVRS